MTRIIACLSAGVLFMLLVAACGKPLADFTYTGEQHVAPADVSFENRSKGAESYEWDFGDGNTSTEASPAHVYKGSGNYSVKLKAIKGSKTTISEKKTAGHSPAGLPRRDRNGIRNDDRTTFQCNPTTPG